MPSCEDSEIPEPISKQLLDIREKPKDVQLNDEAVRSVLGGAMRAARELRKLEELERPPSKYRQADEENFEGMKESVSLPLNSAQ